MKKQNIIGWVILMVLLFAWTTFKSKQAQELARKKAETQYADSLAHAKDKKTNEVKVMSNTSLVASSAVASSTTTSAGIIEAVVDSAKTQIKPFQIKVETKQFTVTLDNVGARIVGIQLLSIAGKKVPHPELIASEKGGALGLSLDGKDLSQVLWQVDTTKSEYLVNSQNQSLVFNYTFPDGKIVKRTYTFYPDSSKFHHDLDAPGFAAGYSMDWNSGLEETEVIPQGKGVGVLSSFFSEVVLDNGVNVERVTFVGKKTFNAESGVLRWVGLRRRYLAILLNFNRETTHRVDAVGVLGENEDKSHPHNYQLAIDGPRYEDHALDFDFVVLPLSYEKLLSYHQNYEKIIFSGWEWLLRADIWYVALCGFILKLLNFFHGLIPNYGIAIILLTLMVRFITFPLTISQTKSAAKMQQHAPEIKKIREKFKTQPGKMNQEVMAYYSKVGVSPFSQLTGCLPMLLQMPIFISLFNVLGRAVELKDAPFFAWIHDLSRPDVIMSAFKVPYIFPLGLTVLPFFMSGTMFFQMKATIKDENQKFMIWMMPVMMFVFSGSFPSGLVLYWTVSNIFTLAQTHFYTNRLKPASSKEIIVQAKKG